MKLGALSLKVCTLVGENPMAVLALEMKQD